MYTFNVSVTFAPLTVAQSKEEVYRNAALTNEHDEMEVIAPDALTALALVLREHPERELLHVKVSRNRRILLASDSVAATLALPAPPTPEVVAR